jgi:hypothetical protein
VSGIAGRGLKAAGETVAVSVGDGLVHVKVTDRSGLEVAAAWRQTMTWFELWHPSVSATGDG